MSCLTGFSALMLTFSWSVTSSQAVYFQLFQHRLSPRKLRRGKPAVGCGRSHRLFNPAPPEAWLTPDFRTPLWTIPSLCSLLELKDQGVQHGSRNFKPGAADGALFILLIDRGC